MFKTPSFTSYCQRCTHVIENFTEGLALHHIAVASVKLSGGLKINDQRNALTISALFCWRVLPIELVETFLLKLR